MDVVAAAGDNVIALVDEEVTLDGTLSTGNGAVINYTWTFEHDGGTVNLHGAVTAHIFTEPGTYTVTLTVVDSLGLTASDELIVTIDWMLLIGPLTNAKGEMLTFVSVSLLMEGVTHVSSTGSDGVVGFELSDTDLGKDVTVELDKEGYVRYWWYGELNWAGAEGEKFMREKIEALLTADDDGGT